MTTGPPTKSSEFIRTYIKPSLDYKVITEKEYYKLHKDKPTIGLLMMVKNEAKKIHVSLTSILGTVDALIVYDTGSTDNTLEIIQNFSEKHQINLYLIQGNFVDFSYSRNISLEYADTINVEFLVLLDCNDELQGGPILKKFAKDVLSQPNSGFLVCQKWWSGQHDKYFNIRFIRNKCGWRYFGSVHEWMKDTSVDGQDPKHPVIKIPDEVALYQDRTNDDDKSLRRFHKDYELLIRDYEKNPSETRTLFYLSQTCECLGKNDEALYYAKLRLELEGFDEERFHAYMRCGNCCAKLGHNWDDVMPWYVKAYENFNRAEPLVKIADYYKNMNKWHIAYLFIRSACELPYPEHLVLFVDNGAYDYYRWHLMGIIGFYVGKHEEGKSACLKAIEKGTHKELDENNLKFYEQTGIKGPPIHVQPPKELKNQFMERIINDLKTKYPKLPIKSIQSRATKLWKEHQGKTK